MSDKRIEINPQKIINNKPRHLDGAELVILLKTFVG